MDNAEIFNKLELFAQAASKQFNVKKIILFGSLAKGRFTETSDIDVAVIVAESDIDILDSEFKLYKIRRDIDHRIEPVLFVGMEDDSGFLEEILKTGKVIYEAA